MSDEISKDGISSPGELTSADILEAKQRYRRRIEVESESAAAQDESVRTAIPLGPSAGVAATGAAAIRARIDEEIGPLFSSDEANNLRAQWDHVQAGFVDGPRAAVEDANELLAAVMERLTDIFANERQNLERQWETGDDVSTEDLRLALRRYRSFFSRLLKV